MAIILSSKPEYIIKTFDVDNNESIKGPFSEDEIKKMSAEKNLRKSIIYKINLFAITQDLYESSDVINRERMAFTNLEYDIWHAN